MQVIVKTVFATVLLAGCGIKPRGTHFEPVPRAPFSSYAFSFSLVQDTLLPFEPITVLSTIRNVSADSVPDVDLWINLSSPITVRIYVDTFVLGCDNWYVSSGVGRDRWLAPGESRSRESEFCSEVEDWRVPTELRSLGAGRVEIFVHPYVFADHPERPHGVPFIILPFAIRSILGDEQDAFNLISAARKSKIAGNRPAARDSLRILHQRYPGSHYSRLADFWLTRLSPERETQPTK